MKQYEDVENELHELADWIEKRNGVHCHSVPRKAAYLIRALEEDNIQLRLKLNRMDLYPSDYINRVIGLFRYGVYKLRKRLTK